MSLKQIQKNEILRALVEARVDPDRFSWTSLQKLDQPRPLEFPKGTTVLKGKDSPWFLAIAEDRTAWWGPSSQCSTWTLKGRNFEHLMDDVVRPWSLELQKELAEPELWSEESRARQCQNVLLPSQQNEIHRSLRRHSVNFESAKWSGGGSHTALQIEGGKYSLALNWSYNSGANKHIWEGVRCPGKELPREDFKVEGWTAMAAVADRWAQDAAAEQREYALPVVSSVPAEVYQTHRLLCLRLRKIRSFREVEFSLRDDQGDPRMMTVLIGENGTGKTTLLRCIALVLCPKADANVLLSLPQGSILGVESADGSIEIDYLDSDGQEQRRSIRITRVGPREEVEEEVGEIPKLFAYASGVGRSVDAAEVPVAKGYRQYQSVKALFDYNTALANPELVLKRLRDSQPDQFVDILAGWVGALGLPVGTELSLPREGGVEVKQPGRPAIPLASLADGYRLTFAWLLDLYAWAAAAGQPHVEQLSGLLLIDEIERHLHPSMQSTVLSRLRRTYPYLQIITTTHSPMAALGAETGELFVSELQGDGVHLAPGPSMKGLSVEDLVTSEEAFNAPAYAPETADLLEEYDRLSTIPPGERDAAQRALLTELSSQLAGVFRESN